jgi:hypothetical protein
MIINLFLSFILALVLSRVCLNVKNLPYKNFVPAKSCLLLTMHCTPEKSSMYMNVLNLWLNKTNLMIYTVDSANYPALRESSHPRWRALSFNQGSVSLKCYSILELDAVAKAERHFDWRSYDIIFKLTGKYYLPGLEEAIQHVPKEAQLVFQKRNTFIIKYQNSELYGFRNGDAEKMKLEFNPKGAEQSLYERGQKIKNGCYRLPTLRVETQNPRGDGSILKHL